MNTNSVENKALWDEVARSYLVMAQALKEFFAEGVDRVALLKEGLRHGDVAAALYVMRYMSVEELCQLFGELVDLSLSHGCAVRVREIIYSLPRAWVLERIEEVAEPLLSEGTYDEYRLILELYLGLDRELAHKLAVRAAANPDPDIKEAGDDFLEILSSSYG